jgi:uncharacterized protein (TIGR03435 family)
MGVAALQAAMTGRLLILVLLLAAAGLAAQAAPAFDAVSIKRNTSGAQSSSFRPLNGSAFSMTNYGMVAAIATAYPAKNAEIIGAPDWVRTERYDIIAKAAGKPPDAEIRAMLRGMLADRLKLAAHVEPRDIPVYALVVAQPNHPGLKPFTQDCDAILAAREAAATNGVPTPAAGPPPAVPCGFTYSTAIYSGEVTMETLARMINGTGGRVVVDRTNLPGRFDFTLRFARPGMTPTPILSVTPPSPSPNDPPEIFTRFRNSSV